MTPFPVMLMTKQPKLHSSNFKEQSLGISGITHRSRTISKPPSLPVESNRANVLECEWIVEFQQGDEKVPAESIVTRSL